MLRSAHFFRHVHNSAAKKWLEDALNSTDWAEISMSMAYSLAYECTKKKDLEFGRGLQSLIIRIESYSLAILTDHLIRLFASCGSLVEANQSFTKVWNPSFYTWNSIIDANVKLCNCHIALQLYHVMQHGGENPNEFTFSSILKSCSRLGAREQGRLTHQQLIQSGIPVDTVLGSTLVYMYAKCKSLEESSRVLDILPDRNVVSWSAIIAGYVEHAEGHNALECFQRMQKEGIVPNKVTFISILKACGIIGSLEQARCIHEKITEIQFELEIGNTLVDVYSKCGCLDEAHRVFHRLQDYDVVSWAAIIGGCARNDACNLALEYFDSMEHEGIIPNKVTFLSILKACGSASAMQQGRSIHEKIIDNGFQFDAAVTNALIDMYAKCGCLGEACRIFNNFPHQDVISFGALIAGYAQHGKAHLAFEVFEKMQQDAIKPSKATFLSILKACANVGTIEEGRHIHEQIFELGLHSDTIVASTVVDMYAKLGNLDEAHQVFEMLQQQDIVSWGAMIAGYVEHGEGCAAIELFEAMEQKGIKPDKVTFLSILRACGSIGAIEHGRHIHLQIVKCGLHLDIAVGSNLVDMYAKCGSLNEARKVFHDLLNRDVLAWAAMVAGYALLGDAGLAMQCFEGMQCNGVKPDGIAFTSLLTAFCHSGLVTEAFQYFEAIGEYYDIIPDMHHTTCLVHVLGLAGHLSEAEDLLQAAMQPQVCQWKTLAIYQWKTLLTACSMHSNIEIGRKCFDVIVHLDPFYTPAYVLMSNLYASSHMRTNTSKICLGNMRANTVHE